MTRDAATIKIARELAGMTQAELAVKIEVSEPTVRRMEKGDPRIKVATLAKAAKELGLHFDWAERRVVANGTVPASEVDRVMAEAESQPGIDPTTLAAPMVPTWEVDVSANAWVDVPVCQLDANDPQQQRVIESGRFRLRIMGHCMEPEYPSGMTIEFEILHLDREPLQIGTDYVVCRNDGTGTFKRLIQSTEDSITLAALNQKEYPGALLVSRQEVCRVAKVAFRLQPPPAPTVPKIKARQQEIRL